MIENCTALILAGGNSTRMGQDKAKLSLHGQTLLQHVALAMRQSFPAVIVSVRAPRPEIALTQVCDDPAHSGPLAGLAAGLAHAATPWVFAVACDMPFISPALIECLARQRGGDARAVVPVVHSQPQPLAAFYARSCRAELDALLQGRGKHSLRALLDCLPVRYVSEDDLVAADPHLKSFFDLDTPQDVARAVKGGSGNFGLC